jgi:hypothetical protein
MFAFFGFALAYGPLLLGVAPRAKMERASKKATA